MISFCLVHHWNIFLETWEWHTPCIPKLPSHWHRCSWSPLRVLCLMFHIGSVLALTFSPCAFWASNSLPSAFVLVSRWKVGFSLTRNGSLQDIFLCSLFSFCSTSGAPWLVMRSYYAEPILSYKHCKPKMCFIYQTSWTLYFIYTVQGGGESVLHSHDPSPASWKWSILHLTRKNVIQNLTYASVTFAPSKADSLWVEPM